MTTTVGEATKTEIRNFTFNDEDAVAQLEELKQAYKYAEIYLNGELGVVFPEDIKLPIEPNQIVTDAISGSSLKLNYYELERAIALLKEQYAVGTIEIKVIQS